MTIHRRHNVALCQHQRLGPNGVIRSDWSALVPSTATADARVLLPLQAVAGWLAVRAPAVSAGKRAVLVAVAAARQKATGACGRAGCNCSSCQCGEVCGASCSCGCAKDDLFSDPEEPETEIPVAQPGDSSGDSSNGNGSDQPNDGIVGGASNDNPVVPEPGYDYDARTGTGCDRRLLVLANQPQA